MFRALNLLTQPKEGFLDHPTFVVDQTRRFTKQYPNSFLTSQTDPSLIPDTVMGLASWNPNTRQPTQRDLNIAEQAISLDVGAGLETQNNVCKTTPLDTLVDTQDPNARLRCGWVYKRGDPGSRPKVSQGVLATRNGPVPMFDAPDGTFFWDLYDAKKAILRDRCLSMASCTQAGTEEFAECAYSKTRGTGVPVDSKGNLLYPRDAALTAPMDSLVRTSGGCPPPPPPGSPQAEVIRSRDVCAPLADGRLGRDCMLQQVTAAGCTVDGTLYNKLLNSAAPNNYGAGLKNELSFSKYQQLANPPLNEAAIRDGSTSVQTALQNFSALSKLAKEDGNDALHFASRDLCIQRGIMDSFDFCSELVDGSTPPFALECLQKEFRRQGGQPAGSDYPTNLTLGKYNNMNNWAAVRQYIANLARQTKETFTSKRVEGFANEANANVKKLVDDGTLLNYDACVQNQQVIAIATATKKPGDDAALNQTRYALCTDYYNKGFWQGGIDPTIEDRKNPQLGALKRFYGIEEPPKDSFPQINRINGVEYLWFNRGNNSFMGRRLQFKNPSGPNIDTPGVVDGTGLAETVSYIYLTNLRPPSRQQVRLKFVTDDGMLFTLNRQINPDAFANVRVDTDRIFGVNWLQPPTQHIQNSCWTLQANGANYMLGFWYENFGYATSQLQYAPCSGGAYQNIPSDWTTLTIEPDAPMISFEVMKNGGSVSFQEFRLPTIFPLMLSPQVRVEGNGLRMKNGGQMGTASTTVGFSANSWRSFSCCFILGDENLDPQVPPYCQGLGRPSPDGRIRLYDRSECDNLQGIIHGNGECTKPQGGSYSWDCRLAGRFWAHVICKLGDYLAFAAQGNDFYVGGSLNSTMRAPLKNVLKADGKTRNYAVAVMKSEYGNTYPNRITIAVGTEEDWKSGRASLSSPSNSIVFRTNGNSPIFNPSDIYQLVLGQVDGTIQWCRFFDYEMTDKDVGRDLNNAWQRAFVV